MSFDIDKLAEKTEKLSIDPIYDTNWCDMPDDIKLECIGKMQLNERLALRCTAKAERSLVDSKKIGFYQGPVFGRTGFGISILPSYHVSLTLKNGDRFSEMFMNPTQKHEFLIYILKIGVFDNFSVTLNDSDVKEELMNYTGKISAKNIEFEKCDKEIIVAVLQKMNTGVESISIDWDSWFKFERFDSDFDDILAISQVQNVPYWHIKNYNKTDSLYKVAQMWIDKNSKIGFTFQVRMKIDGSFEEFSKHFADSIISESADRARIRTNNPDRHILLEHKSKEFGFGCGRYFRLMVISAEMKESEYDDNFEEWIRNFDPIFYDESSESSFEEYDDEYYYPDELDSFDDSEEGENDWEPADY